MESYFAFIRAIQSFKLLILFSVDFVAMIQSEYTHWLLVNPSLKPGSSRM